VKPADDEETREYRVAPYPPSPEPDEALAQRPPAEAWNPAQTEPPAEPSAWAAPAHQWQQPVRAYQTSAMVALAGIILLIVGLLLTLSAAAGLSLDRVLDDVVRQARREGVELNRQALRQIVSAVVGGFLVVGVLHLLVALGVFLHRQSARFVGVALAVALLGVLWVAAGLAAQQTEFATEAIGVALVFTGLYGYTLIALAAGGGHFRRRSA
jgi:hypothetical protein